ncbi:hypothetical protein CLV59_104506 [Chitinophaga dinghuensis]|uniref:Uncharacterized protein n=2 Tax=Chitinophaga dinghuensis TaxID=1539050 RepID=A0A327VYY4_9BACT|nr:hypothetical protein CLV59_104506 [Chitinophaga dinghuensis]
MMSRSIQLSFFLSALSIIATTWINIAIAQRYLHADGKTRALFGIIEMTYGFQYGVAIAGIAALLLSLIGKSGSQKLRIAAVVISILSVILVFLRMWRLFVL